jgi:hypothetical protein
MARLKFILPVTDNRIRAIELREGFLRTHKLPPKVRHYIAELESLSVAPKSINELNDDKEMEDLVDNIKLTMFEDFKSTY